MIVPCNTLSDSVENIIEILMIKRIDGQLCWFNGKYFKPLKAKKELE